MSATPPPPPPDAPQEDGPGPRLPDDLDWTSASYRGAHHRSHHGGDGEHHGDHHGRGHGRGHGSGRGRGRGRSKRHHWYRPRNVIGIPLLILALLLAGTYLYVEHELNGIRRAPLNADFGGSRSQGTNVLLLGSDAPADALRLDRPTMVIQLVHLAAGGTQAAVINLPRDLLLTGAGGAGSETLQAAYDTNGDSAVVDLIQQALGITVDHVSQISFTGYAKVTDTLGGVDLPTLQGVRSFTGAQALQYTAATDVSSIESGRRNQQWLKAILTETFTPSVLLNPFRLLALLHDTTPNLVLDEGFTTGALRSLVLTARHLRPSTIRYLTAPYRGYADRHRQRVLLPDEAALRQLGAAVAADNASGIAVFDN